MKDVLKKLVVFSLATFTTVSFLGCGLTDPEDADEVSISLDKQSIDLPKGNQAPAITATLEGSDVATLSVDVTDADGNDASTDLTVTPVAPSEKDEDVTITVTAGDVCGDYKVTITATVGEAEDVAILNVTVTGCGTSTGTPVETVTIDAGGQGSTTLGSSIDIDAGEVMMSGPAGNNLSSIDLCYLFSNSDSQEKFFTPSHAKNSGFFGSWGGTPPTTKFYKLSGVVFDDVETKEDVEALWDESQASTESIAAAEGDVFIIETTEGAIALITITDQTGGASGSIKAKIAQ